MIDLQDHAEGVVIPIRANAGAKRNEIGGEHDGLLRISVTQAPEKGKANQAIIELLSKRLNCSKSACELISGETSPRKRILVRGVPLIEARRLLEG